MPERIGYVYAVGMLGRTFVKIGHTMNKIEYRLKRLHIEHRVPLYVIGTVAVDGTRANGPLHLELQVHAMCKDICHAGEWYEMALDQESFYALVDKAYKSMPQKKRPQLRSLDYLCGRTDEPHPAPRVEVAP